MGLGAHELGGRVGEGVPKVETPVLGSDAGFGRRLGEGVQKVHARAMGLDAERARGCSTRRSANQIYRVPIYECPGCR